MLPDKYSSFETVKFWTNK